MAIYHFSAKLISRSAGRSAVAAAAYRSASELHDERAEQRHDFRAKGGVVHSEILLPQGAPERLSDRATLWNAVEASEKRKDAQLAREVEFALPRELSRAEGIALARDFVQATFVSRGMVADLNLHWDQAADGSYKPHAHVLLTLRAVGPEGFGAKERSWNAREELVGWRERWAGHVNTRLAELGHDVRIDHRSLADQGLALEPQHKIGPAGARREARDEDAERADEHRAIAARNGDRIAADPTIALTALTQQSSTFTRQDLARLIHRHSDGEAQFTPLMAKVEASPELVRLGQDARGQERFTTRMMLGIEARMEQAAERLSRAEGHAIGSSLQEAALRARSLGAEQDAAFRSVTGGADLALVTGYAGTGKSTMLAAARVAWEAAGYTVRGAALSGIAAENLEAGSGILSRTLASLEHAWGQGRDALTSRDVLVIDEAGMVGSRQMERVLSAAQTAGAKIVLVGDPEQLQAIEAGAAFRALLERHGAAEITQVRRQEEAWQRAATRELATGRTGEALARYVAAGRVQAQATRLEAQAALVAAWDAERQAAPEKSRMILASTRVDVAELNRLARARMRAAGALGVEAPVETERGTRAFAPGDRLMFLRNERSLGVKNGSLGWVERVESGGMSVRLDGPEGRVIGFELKDYAHVEHGYAATVHKAQGVTVDRIHLLASPLMDRHSAYVGLTRHREAVTLHYGQDDFGDIQALARGASRERAQETTLDYAAGFAERRGIVPASTIVVERPAEPELRPEPPAPRLGRFAGLKLGRAPARPMLNATSVEADPAAFLSRAVDGYVAAFADAARMRRADLPVLPHQDKALAEAAARLDALDPETGRDLRAALARRPELAARAAEGRAALLEAVAEERRLRHSPELRAQRYAARWAQLEQVSAAARQGPEAVAARAALQALAGEIRRDGQAAAVLKRQARDLGLQPGSGLARALDGRSARAVERSGPSPGFSR